MHCRPCKQGTARSAQGGAALVVALLVFALSTALIVAMKSDFLRLYQRGANIFLAEQSQAYLRGAEGLASIALLVDYDQDRTRDAPRDDLEEIWAQAATPYPLDQGGWLSGELEDLQGRFNLNLLAEQPPEGEGGPRFSIAQAQFIRLLQSLGEPQLSEQEAIVVTRAVADWLDEDSIVRPDGAEDDFYLGMTPPYRAANRPMVSVSELRSVSSVSPELYLALEPWVTVWPARPEPLNIHTAPATVLRSIGSDQSLLPLSESDAEALAQYRLENGFVNLQNFLGQPAFIDAAGQMEGMKALLGEHSSYFLLRAQVEVAGRNTRLYSVLERRGRRVNALVRVSGSL